MPPSSGADFPARKRKRSISAAIKTTVTATDSQHHGDKQSANDTLAHGVADDAGSIAASSDSLQQFVSSWCPAHAVNVGNTRVDSGQYGRGLFATQDIAADSVICSIPLQCAVTMKHAQRSIIGQHVAEYNQSVDAAAAINDRTLFFLYFIHCRAESSSDFHLYFRGIPQQYDDPLWWSAAELQLLQGTNMLTAAVHQQQILRDTYDKTLQPLFNKHSDVFPLGVYSYDALLWAHSSYTSRGFPARLADPRYAGNDNVVNAVKTNYAVASSNQSVVAEAGTAGCANNDVKAAEPSPAVASPATAVASPAASIGVMLPYLDLGNHEYATPITWLTTDSTISFIAGRHIAAGAEIFNNYGAKSNDEFLHSYGFCLADNPHDEVTVEIGVRNLPPLHQRMMEALQLPKSYYLTKLQPLPSQMLHLLRLMLSSAEDLHMVSCAEDLSIERLPLAVEWQVLQHLHRMLAGKLQKVVTTPAYQSDDQNDELMAVDECLSYAAQSDLHDQQLRDSRYAHNTRAQLAITYRRGQRTILAAAVEELMRQKQSFCQHLQAVIRRNWLSAPMPDAEPAAANRSTAVTAMLHPDAVAGVMDEQGITELAECDPLLSQVALITQAAQSRTQRADDETSDTDVHALRQLADSIGCHPLLLWSAEDVQRVQHDSRLIQRVAEEQADIKHTYQELQHMDEDANALTAQLQQLSPGAFTVAYAITSATSGCWPIKTSLAADMHTRLQAVAGMNTLELQQQLEQPDESSAAELALELVSMTDAEQLCRSGLLPATSEQAVIHLPFQLLLNVAQSKPEIDKSWTEWLVDRYCISEAELRFPVTCRGVAFSLSALSSLLVMDAAQQSQYRHSATSQIQAHEDEDGDQDQELRIDIPLLVSDWRAYTLSARGFSAPGDSMGSAAVSLLAALMSNLLHRLEHHHATAFARGQPASEPVSAGFQLGHQYVQHQVCLLQQLSQQLNSALDST